ncbi:MAG TPA: XRE family transcriptional regulator [Chloroflexota bacterium]|nr:XRE family transcriptional regulator [Chloroflexota bacterium]
MSVTAEQAVHGLATRLELPALVRSLQDVLGQRLVAVVAGVADAKAVGKWARGERAPHPDAERRLRHAFQVAQLLLQAESAETVRAWFVGMNPDLVDRPPAEALAEDPVGVLQAARAFLAHG